MTADDQLRVVVLHNHDNSWDEADIQESINELHGMTTALEAHGCQVRTAQVHHSVRAVLDNSDCDPRKWLVFNWCEGYADRPWDYAGVTDELDQLRYVYTGASSWTLRMTEDKRVSRRLLMQAGVPLPPGTIADTPHEVAWDIYPAIVKPVNQHGSYGIDRGAVVRDERELRRRIEYVRDTFDSAALIEEFIEGREFHVTVWGNTHDRDAARRGDRLRLDRGSARSSDDLRSEVRSTGGIGSAAALYLPADVDLDGAAAFEGGLRAGVSGAAQS